MVDFDVIEKLIKMVEESDITGLAVEEGGTKIEVRREKGGVVVAEQQSVTTAPADRPQHSGSSASEALPSNMVPITSPMVGTFYRAASPDAKAFVEVGDSVGSGKVVCIIEAMKLFNQIESEVSGKISKILVENGQPVEYGQHLMLVEKEG
jgi:acetyl-CoA carboxylase biotin carboxyl carrier protein